MSVDHSPGRWPRRRLAAFTLRAVVATAPAAVALAVSWAMRVLLPPNPTMTARVLWIAVTVPLALAAAIGMTRLVRRAAPLAWLLKLDVVFPGEAPSRFAVALRAGRTADLAEDLQSDRLHGDDAAAAQRIVEFAAALTAHDRPTRGHSERVRGYTRVIGESMGIAADDLDKLAWAGLLHDVGKLVIDPEVLNKPCGLDEAEMAVMRRHPTEGARLARPLMPWLGPWGLAIADHHERWDGSGYPAGLSGERISLGGRIVAVADAFEAMTAPRPYNTPRTLEAARRELVDCAEHHFDPEVVRALLAVPLRRLSRIALPSAALGMVPSLHGALEGLGEGMRVAPVVMRQAAVATAGTAMVAATSISPGGHPLLHDPSPEQGAVVQAAATGQPEEADLTAAAAAAAPDRFAPPAPVTPATQIGAAVTAQLSTSEVATPGVAAPQPVATPPDATPDRVAHTSRPSDPPAGPQDVPDAPAPAPAPPPPAAPPPPNPPPGPVEAIVDGVAEGVADAVGAAHDVVEEATDGGNGGGPPADGPPGIANLPPHAAAVETGTGDTVGEVVQQATSGGGGDPGPGNGNPGRGRD